MAAKSPKTPKKRPIRWGRALLAAGLVVLVAVGTYHRYTLRLAHVDVRGAHHADVDALVALARVDTAVLLYDLDPDVIADRVARHPWVATARATRLPTGTLALDVTERVPVAAVLGPDGRDAYYLDAHGFTLPAVDGAFFDVPLLEGVARPHPTQPVPQRGVRELLGALATLTPDEHALVSNLRVEPDGTVTLYTTRAPQGSTLPVLLGRSGFRAAFTKLRAFWDAAVLTRPGTRFDHLDLRFSSQIITREG